MVDKYWKTLKYWNRSLDLHVVKQPVNVYVVSRVDLKNPDVKPWLAQSHFSVQLLNLIFQIKAYK